MSDAPVKAFTPRTTRRSLLKGLGAAAVGISLLSKKSPAWAEEEKKLNFYNWDTYIGETTLETFREASGIDVNMSLFATNDELFAKLRAGNPGFDVIVPGSEFVERMIKAELLGGPSIGTPDRELLLGDRVICLQNDRRLGVLNGDLATIVSVDTRDRSAVVRLDRESEARHLPAWYLDAGHVDHGYALTGHKAQGVTVDHTFAVDEDDIPF